MYKIGVIGKGFVGGAIVNSLKKKKIKDIIVYDKYKDNGIGDKKNYLDTDFLFICVPTNYEDSIKSFDLINIEEHLIYLNENKYKNPVIIKSTLEPESCNNFKKKYNLNIVYNPEFLSEKTADYDFHNQKHIILGGDKKYVDQIEEFYNRYYPEAIISKMSLVESECVKIFCNSFYAVKIQFFNELYSLCDNCDNCDFNKIKKAMILNGWINPMHTNVPGSDGKLSYGGKCFPKDTNTLNEYLKRKNLNHKVLESVILERNIMRK